MKPHGLLDDSLEVLKLLTLGKGHREVNPALRYGSVDLCGRIQRAALWRQRGKHSPS